MKKNNVDLSGVKIAHYRTVIIDFFGNNSKMRNEPDRFIVVNGNVVKDSLVEYNTFINGSGWFALSATCDSRNEVETLATKYYERFVVLYKASSSYANTLDTLKTENDYDFSFDTKIEYSKDVEAITLSGFFVNKGVFSDNY